MGDRNVLLATGSGMLYGTLTGDIDSKPPLALIVPDVPPTDRSYALLAEALAAQGVASLRYDRRWALRWSLDRMKRDVIDASLWVEKLQRTERFPQMAIVGHGEGALVGMLAAQRSRVDAFIGLECKRYRGSEAYDLAHGIANLGIGVTLVAGTADPQSGVEYARSLAAARPAARLVVVGAMNHALQCGYDPRLPVASAVVDAIALALLDASS